MADSSEDELLLLDSVLPKIILGKRKRMGVHEINKRRRMAGEYHHLFPLLKRSPSRFQSYLRMSQETFKYILEKIEPKITKKWRNWHQQPILPEERLVITLRIMVHATLLRWFGLGFSILTTVFLGLELAFNVYAIPLKQTYNFTQTDVELISSSSLMGLGASLIEPLIYSKYGYRTSYVLIWGLTSGSAFLMWLSSVYKDYLAAWPSVICLIQFLMSASQNAGSTRMTAIALGKLPAEYSARLVAIYFSATSLGKVFYGLMVEFVFIEDLSSFFLFATVLMTVSVGICYFTHYPEDNIPEKMNYEPLTDNNSGKDQSNLTMLKSPFFHLTLWPSAFLYSIVYTLVNNITSIAHSVFVSQPLYMSYIFAGTVMVCRVSFGTIYDKSGASFIGFVFMLIGSLAMLLACTLSVFVLNMYTMYIVAVCIGICTSTAITIPSAMLSLRFGSHQYPYVVGSIYCFTGAMCLILQYIVGYFYDQQRTLDGFCYGESCFLIPWLIFCGITVLAISVQLVNCFKNNNTLK